MELIEAIDADFASLVEGQAPRGLRIPMEGIERREVLEMLRSLASSIRPLFSPASWLMVEGGEVVGLCSIVKEPSERGIDIGYGVSPGRRKIGFASAAVAALLDWSRQDDRIDHVRAETSVSNLASHRVLERNGFDRVGERVDEEDGELICWSAAASQ